MNDWLKFVLKLGCWGFGVLILLLILFYFSGWPEGYCYFYPSIGTRFAPGFSERAFSKVQPGMSCTQVSNLLGAPLISTEIRGGVEEWYYSLDKASGPDFAWLVRIVESTNGIVVRTVKRVEYN